MNRYFMDLDIYYRALTDYRNNTREERECETFRKAISSADATSSRIEIIKTNCIIEEDWIKAIEDGLEHVSKAIAEERQFIRSNGEVVPIEKVKSVSKDSIEHLARHGNFISRVPGEGEDIVPDQLYSVEKLSDFAVYENRFLYMMLCFLRDFITYRYDKIVDLTNTYNGKLEIKKHIHYGGRTLVYELKLDEEIKNDRFLKENNPVKEQIDRISIILKSVTALLNTPLMEFVAKSPMLKPPVTETNVLKMNKNFRGAKELYYYISGYSKDGFSIEQKTEIISPFNDGMSDEFSEIVALNAFLTYEHGMGIEKVLKDNFDKREKELQEQKKQELEELIESMKRRMRQTGKTETDYILNLEKQNKQLKTDTARLASVEAQYRKADQELKGISGKVEELNGKIDSLNERHSIEIAEIKKSSAEELHAKDVHCKEEVERVNKECNDKITAQKEECDKIVAEAEEEKKEKLKSYDELMEKYNRTLEDKRLLEARLVSLLIETGQATPEHDFTTSESFDEIENQYKTFKKYFRQKWKTAKKQIRKDILNSENIKKMSDKRTAEPQPAELQPAEHQEIEEDESSVLEAELNEEYQENQIED